MYDDAGDVHMLHTLVHICVNSLCTGLHVLVRTCFFFWGEGGSRYITGERPSSWVPCARAHVLFFTFFLSGGHHGLSRVRGPHHGFITVSSRVGWIFVFPTFLVLMHVLLIFVHTLVFCVVLFCFCVLCTHFVSFERPSSRVRGLHHG